MTTHETGHGAASSEGTVTVTEEVRGLIRSRSPSGIIGSSPTSHGRLATTQGQHPTTCYLPASGHVHP